jgi:predicted ATPase
MFIGRDHELEVLSKYLDSAFMGNGKTIFVSGEAGSGKTRLINEFLYQAQKKNINVITGWCLSNATIPYFPFIEAFSPFSSNVKGIFSSDSFQVISESSELVQAHPGLFNNNQTLAPQVLMDKIFS